MKYRNLFLSLFAAGSTLFAGNLPSPGGVSVDFSKAKSLAAERSGAPNLASDGNFVKSAPLKPVPWIFSPGVWYTNYWVHLLKQDGDYQALMKLIHPYLHQTAMKENGRSFARLESTMEAWKYKTPKNKDVVFSNQLIQYIYIQPSAAGKRYELTLQSRGKLFTKSNANELRGFIRFADGTERGKLKNLPGEQNFWFRTSTGWSAVRKEFVIPPKTRRVQVILALYGPGVWDIADFRIAEIQSKESLKCSLFPQEQLDGIFTLGQNAANVVTFGFSNPGKAKTVQPKFELQLPAGFTCSDSDIPQTAVRKEKEGTIYTFDLSRLSLQIKPVSGTQRNFMVRTKLAPGEKLYTARWRVIDNGRPSNWQQIKFKVLPREVRPAPKRFRTGLYPSHQHIMPQSESKAAYSLDYADAGFNFLQGWFPYRDKGYDVLKKRGVIRSYENWFMADGFHFGQGKKPENAMFRQADGKPLCAKGGKTPAVCPSEIIEQGPYFRAEIKRILTDPLTKEDSCDTMMANHEPFVFNGKGCFCARCREAFVRYLKQQKQRFDEKDFRAKWPGSASNFSEHFIRFCSLRHAEAVKVFNKTAMEAGKKVGKRASYIPEINWVELEKQSVPVFRYYSALDYMRDLPILEPWGPYLFHDMAEPYIYTPGYHLITWGAAKAVKEFLRNNISDPAKRPQVYAFPHGVQCGTWITEPEAISFETFCFFLHKWEGSIVYHYNLYDYKYFAELARMNEILAAYENFIFDGKERTGDKAESVTPIIGIREFQPWLNGDNIEGFLCIRPEKMAGYIGKENALRLKSFQLKDRILVAAGNFWQKGECFFKLKLKDLKPNARYTVRQAVEKRNFGSYTGAELMNKGVLLHAGALRFAFYTVEEGSKALPGETVISQNDMKKLMAQRLPAIRKAFAFERAKVEKWEKLYAGTLAQEKAALAGKCFDFDVQPNVSNEQVMLSPSGVAVQVTAGTYTVKLQPTQGGLLTEWVVKGKRIDAPSAGYGLALDTLFKLNGAASLTKPMRLESVEPVKGGVRAVLVRKLTSSDSKVYQGCTLTKTYLFRKAGFTAKTELKNTTPKTLSVVLRQHNYAPNGMNGGVLTIGKKTFQRDMRHKILRLTPDTSLEKWLNLPGYPVTESKMVFTAPWSPAVVTASVTGKFQPEAILIWEGGKAYTAEYIFPVQVLTPGKSCSFETNWDVAERK